MLFLSHSGNDSEAALKLAKTIENSEAAQQAGLRVWIDKKDLDPGSSWLTQLEEAIKQSTSFAVYIGESGVINWVQMEVNLAIKKAVSNKDYLFLPILSATSQGYESLPGFLSLYQGIDDIDNSTDKLHQLINICIGKEKTAGTNILRKNESPFVGLSAFSIKQSHLFFGRENETKLLIKSLNKTRLLMITGDSGSGKSSLVKAGLIPSYLGRELLLDHDNIERQLDERSWHVLETRPGENPFERLQASLEDMAKSLGRSYKDIKEYNQDVRGKNSELIYDALSNCLPKHSNLLLFVDQFEELFNVYQNIKPFINTLKYLSEHEGNINIHIVLTMRRDYYNLCSEYKDFYNIINQHKFVLRRIHDANLKKCIQKPMELAGYLKSDSESFVTTVLNDLGDESSELTLLQIALTKTWDRKEKFNNDLIKAYQDAQGVSGALAKLAEDTWEQLNKKEKNIAPALFVRLTKLGDTGGVIRRLVGQQELDSASWALAQKLASTLDEKGKTLGRLLVISGKGKEPDYLEIDDKQQTVEIIHEALITQWPKYQTWVQNSARNNRKRIHDQVMQKATSWDEANRPQSRLLTGYDLAEALYLSNSNETRDTYIILSKIEEDFVESSKLKERKDKKALENERQRTRTALNLLHDRLSRYLVLEVRNSLGLKTKNSSIEGNPLLATLLAKEAADSKKESYTVDALRHTVEAWRYQNTSIILSNPTTARTLAFNYDSSLLASAGDEGIIRLWDRTQINIEPKTLHAHTGIITSIDFNDTGKLLISGCVNNNIHLWDLTTPEEPIFTYSKHEGGVKQVGFSHDGKYFASLNGLRKKKTQEKKGVSEYNSVFEKSTLRIWSLDSLETDPVLLTYNSLAYSWDISSDGKKVAICYQSGEILIFDFITKNRFPTNKLSPDKTLGLIPKLIKFSPDGKLLYSIYKPDNVNDKSDRISLWMIDQEQPRFRIIVVVENPITALALSPNGKWLIAGSTDNSVSLYRTKSMFNKEPKITLHRFNGKNKSITSVTVHPDSQSFVIASEDKTIRFLAINDNDRDALSSNKIASYEENCGEVLFSRDGGKLSTTGDGFLHIWQTNSKGVEPKPLANLEINNSIVSVNHDINLIAQCNERGAIIINSLKNNDEYVILPQDNEVQIRALAFSTVGGFIASANKEGTNNIIRVWEWRKPDIIYWEYFSKSEISYLTFSPDGKLLIFSDDQGELKHQNIGYLGQKPFLIHETQNEKVICPTFSPNGKYIVVAILDTIAIWEVKYISENPRKIKHGHIISSIAFHPNNRFIATGDDTGNIDLWDCLDLDAGKKSIAKEKGSITSLSFKPDGKALVSLEMKNKTVRQWDDSTWNLNTRYNNLVDEISHAEGRNMTPDEWHKYMGEIPYRNTCSTWYTPKE